MDIKNDTVLYCTELCVHIRKHIYLNHFFLTQANGFLGAQGFAGAIPAAYTQLAKGFLSRVLGGGQGGRVGLQEYQKPSWTFHAKGLWYYPPHNSLPSFTMIGSPNFGEF